MPPTKLAIGLMTGSSMDGIDAAILETDGKFVVRHIAGATDDYSDGFKMALRIAEYAMQQTAGDLQYFLDDNNFDESGNGTPGNGKLGKYIEAYLRSANNKHLSSTNTLDKILHEFEISLLEQLTFELIITALTKKHAKLVRRLLDEGNLSAADIEVIGFHGQNLYHNPSIKKTIQIGDGQLLSDLTGITVVNNFRHNDVMAGGQGAPLAPLYHFALAGGHEVGGNIYDGVDRDACASVGAPIALLNCGGIANITIINDDNPNNMIAYDTGPGNVLIDRYIRQVSGNDEYMDKDGKYGKQGKVNTPILQILRKEAISGHPGDFLSKLPPKSLDTNHFTLPNEVLPLSREDACATLEYFTAECIVFSLKLLPKSIVRPRKYVLAGGGWRNPVIYDSLVTLLQKNIDENCEIFNADELGWSGRFMEAELFAYLAFRNLNNQPIALPNITGAKNPTISDNVYNQR